MIEYILGAKGAGKTKWLIDQANEDIKNGNGNIAFVEVDDDHIFSLDYNVRLINATEYRLDNMENFYGFLCGLFAMDYDLEKIYVDGIYKVIKLSQEDLKELSSRINSLGLENRKLYVNVDYLLSEMDEDLKSCSQEVNLDN